MDEIAKDNELKENDRDSKEIIYSTKIFDENLEENKNTKIILRELTKEGIAKEKHIWAIILNYVIDNIPQEVIIGTLKNTEQRKDKAMEIIKMISHQLKENTNPETGYEYFKMLCLYLKKMNVPFEFTMEGINILENKNKQNSSLIRTYYSDNKGKLQCRFGEDVTKKVTDEKQSKLLEIQKWIERRKKILNSLKTSEQKDKFVKGEKITKFLHENDQNLNLQKDIVSYCLLDAFHENNNEDDFIIGEAKEYINIKEKGIAIDLKKVLENLESKYFRQIEEYGGAITPSVAKNLEKIQDFEKFFDIVKMGKDWNARCFALKLKKIDFNCLRRIVKYIDPKDTELIEYLDLKEKMMNELQTDSIEVDYNKYNTPKEMYNFLLHSSIREDTKEEDTKKIRKVYDKYIREKIICRNYDEIELYNHYAEKSNIPTCKIPEEKETLEKELEMLSSKALDKTCERLEDRIEGKEENNKNKNNQNQNDQAQQEGQEYDD